MRSTQCVYLGYISLCSLQIFAASLPSSIGSASPLFVGTFFSFHFIVKIIVLVVFVFALPAHLAVKCSASTLRAAAFGGVWSCHSHGAKLEQLFTQHHFNMLLCRSLGIINGAAPANDYFSTILHGLPAPIGKCKCRNDFPGWQVCVCFQASALITLPM